MKYQLKKSVWSSVVVNEEESMKKKRNPPKIGGSMDVAGTWLVHFVDIHDREREWSEFLVVAVDVAGTGIGAEGGRLTLKKNI